MVFCHPLGASSFRYFEEHSKGEKCARSYCDLSIYVASYILVVPFFICPKEGSGNSWQEEIADGGGTLLNLENWWFYTIQIDWISFCLNSILQNSKHMLWITFRILCIGFFQFLICSQDVVFPCFSQFRILCLRTTLYIYIYIIIITSLYIIYVMKMNAFTMDDVRFTSMCVFNSFCIFSSQL